MGHECTCNGKCGDNCRCKEIEKNEQRILEKANQVLVLEKE